MDKAEVLKSVFGHDAFREGQEKLIDELVAGYDVLGVMPTGAGKSVCYQIPALMMDGVALVVSPLISLMKDQVTALKASGVAAAYINSSLTPGQQAEAIRRAANGAYKIIYVAPERLMTPSFIAFARQTRLSLVAVDEAHCVSQWGQDFRPSYLHIAEFVRQLPVRPPVAAFTATATPRVKQDMMELLQLREPYCVTTGYNRPNLRLSSVKPTNKLEMLRQFLDEHPEECGIIYCSTRKNVEDVARRLCEAGYSATRYHAGLSDEERRRNQENFQYDRARVMVATNAFGMGIDKSNVRFVVHYNMPKDLESYYQEAGRAGRDGSPAECLLMYSGQDVVMGKWMIEHNDENPGVSPDQRQVLRQRDLERLRQMTYYATGNRCLRRFILEYFGEKNAPDHCDSCSVCSGDPFEVDTGTSRAMSASARKTALREERRAQRQFTAWENALYDNLQELRKLLAVRNGVPSYVIFSDASLADMVRKRPKTMADFLEISGVGLLKQQKYGPMFLAVIRDGREPNEALEMEGEEERTRHSQRIQVGKPWSAEEEQQLRAEFDGEIPVAEIAKRHMRKAGGIRARLKKLGLME